MPEQVDWRRATPKEFPFGVVTGCGWEVPLGVQLEFVTLFLVLGNLVGMLQDWGAPIIHVNHWGGTVSHGSQQWNAIEKGRTGEAWSHPTL